jgi:hypothetical protein
MSVLSGLTGIPWSDDMMIRNNRWIQNIRVTLTPGSLLKVPTVLLVNVSSEVTSRQHVPGKLFSLFVCPSIFLPFSLPFFLCHFVPPSLKSFPPHLSVFQSRILRRNAVHFPYTSLHLGKGGAFPRLPTTRVEQTFGFYSTLHSGAPKVAMNPHPSTKVPLV